MGRDPTRRIELIGDQAQEGPAPLSPPPPPSRVPRIVLIVGCAIVILQLTVFVIFNQASRVPAGAAESAADLASRPGCTGVTFRAYVSLARYIGDHGRPPRRLLDLAGDYVDQVPLDPVSGLPLGYRSDGTRFTVVCPSPAGEAGE